jgi:hypothetical protein
MNPVQEKQIAFLEKRESSESLARGSSLDVSCNDCKEGFRCSAAITALGFIRKHQGHRTWVKSLS